MNLPPVHPAADAAALPGFCSAAVAASTRRMQALRAQGYATDDPLNAGVSYCLPALKSSAAILRRARRIVLGAFVLGLVLIAAGILVFVAFKLPGDWPPELTGADMPAMSLAVGCVVVGMVVCFVGVGHPRRVIRKLSADRLPAEARRREATPRCVMIEDPGTFQRFKVVAEDFGWLVCYPETTSVQIEGVVCRYLIYGPDVVGISLAPATVTTAVLLSYRIDAETLTLALFEQSATAELRSAVQPGTHGLFEALRQTLGWRESNPLAAAWDEAAKPPANDGG